MEFKDQSMKAGALRKSGNFKEAVMEYELLFENFKDTCNEFDWWGYAQSMLKEDIYQKALEIAEAGLQKYPESKYLNNVYCWSLYHVAIKPEPVQNEENFMNAANRIMSACALDQKFTPYNITAFQVIDFLEQNYELNKESIGEWLAKLDIASLSASPYKMTLADGKNITIASEKEKYYMISTKLHFETDKFNECIDQVYEALGLQLNFSNNNDSWLRRLKALSLYKLDKYDEAIAEFKEVLKFKQDWFIKKELAEVLMEAGKTDEALVRAIDAADDKGSDEMKVKLYMLLSRLFFAKDMKKEAVLHAKLALAVREEQGWSADRDAESMLSECNLPDEFPESADSLLEMATKCWIAYTESTAERFTGVIKNLLPNGKAGFITGDDGKGYYFRLQEVTGLKGTDLQGKRVSFSKETSFDKSKNVDTIVAVNIRPIT